MYKVRLGTVEGYLLYRGNLPLKRLLLLAVPSRQGFDLLDPSHDSKKLEDLPKVSLMEDEDGNIHLRNLSLYLAANEEEALNYLFLGDTNRAISETAMNKASSRSHCIFTVSEIFQHETQEEKSRER